MQYIKVCGRHFWLLLLLLLPLQLQAQQFSVSRFRVIPNDLTAFHAPVYDLNHDACALIKVVCSADFVFDSPLGIVKRTDEVGEVWLYLPQGSVLLTIRHPQWGVLRDYRLEEALAGNITYEMVITPMQQVVLSPLGRDEETPVLEDVTEAPSESAIPVEEIPEPAPQIAVPAPWHLMALGNLGISSKTVAYGLRIGMLRKHGVYLLAETDFASANQTDGECNADGIVSGTNSAAYYTGEVQRSLLKLMGGGIHRIVGGLHLYEGVGYGRYLVVWEAANGKHYKNTADSAIGLSAEAGALYQWGKMAFSAGVSTIAAKHWEAMVGVGICL